VPPTAFSQFDFSLTPEAGGTHDKAKTSCFDRDRVYICLFWSSCDLASHFHFDLGSKQGKAVHIGSR
jgi:hypothetical protein